MAALSKNTPEITTTNANLLELIKIDNEIVRISERLSVLGIFYSMPPSIWTEVGLRIRRWRLVRQGRRIVRHI